MKIPSSEHGENMLCTEIDFDIQNNLYTQHVSPPCSAKIRASDKDLPVHTSFSYENKIVGPQFR